jgi:hypothetical protein
MTISASQQLTLDISLEQIMDALMELPAGFITDELFLENISI